MKTGSKVSEPVSVRRFAPAPVSAARKAVNLAAAAAKVATAVVADPAAPVLVPAEIEASRLGKCAACPEARWNAQGNAGLGECQHPSCGCTAYKLKFAALACPLAPPEWTAWKPEGST